LIDRPATFASPPDSPSLELYGTLAGVGRGGLIFYAFLFGLVGHGIGYRVIPCHLSIKSGRKDTKQIDQTPEGQSTALPRGHSPGSRLAFPPVSLSIYIWKFLHSILHSYTSLHYIAHVVLLVYYPYHCPYNRKLRQSHFCHNYCTNAFI
jgi:hypothetical protein